MSFSRTQLSAFSDELSKISMSIGQNIEHAVSQGWHGHADLGSAPQTGTGWRWNPKGKIGRFMPGAKALTLAGAIPTAMDALKKEDPTGRGRGRLERAAGAAGNILGGLAGSGFAMRRGNGMLLNLAGGIGGGLLGEKLMAAPFAASRRLNERKMAKRMATQDQGQPHVAPSLPGEAVPL